MCNFNFWPRTKLALLSSLILSIGYFCKRGRRNWSPRYRQNSFETWGGNERVGRPPLFSGSPSSFWFRDFFSIFHLFFSCGVRSLKTSAKLAILCADFLSLSSRKKRTNPFWIGVMSVALKGYSSVIRRTILRVLPYRRFTVFLARHCLYACCSLRWGRADT